MGKIHILCVIANDAAPGDDKRSGYTGVGSNYQVRVHDALDWVNEHLVTTPVIWAFGAGTDETHKEGVSLAVRCYQYLKAVEGEVLRFWANSLDKHYFGTLEEILWIVNTAITEYEPREVQFVFFTQKRHMWRVQFIWWLFHQAEWGPAQFVVTGESKQLPLLREIGGMWKAWRVYRGYATPRSQTPYPVDGIALVEYQ